MPALYQTSNSSGQSRAGRYEYISQLAIGPLGTLWVARVAEGPELGRVVAIRRITRDESFVDDAIGEQLAGAATIAMTIRHPRVAAVLDVVTTPREIAVVSEYVEGELLRSLQRRAGLKNRPFSIRFGLRVGLDALRAVQGVAQTWSDTVNTGGASADPGLLGAAFGGLSTDSLLLASYGEAVLLDAGVTGMAAMQPSIGGHPDVLPYRAPEQVEATRVVDERADVFSAAILIWELLANRPLFGSPKYTRFVRAPDDPTPPAETPLADALRRRVLGARIARLDAVVRAGERVPTPIADVVASALERDPAQRTQTLAEMIDGIESLGEEYIATSDEMADAVAELAGTSIEARRAAVAAVTGQARDSDKKPDSVRPTLPPHATAPKPAEPRLEPLAPTHPVKLPLPGARPGSAATPDSSTGQPSPRNKPPLPQRSRKVRDDE